MAPSFANAIIKYFIDKESINNNTHYFESHRVEIVGVIYFPFMEQSDETPMQCNVRFVIKNLLAATCLYWVQIGN